MHDWIAAHVWWFIGGTIGIFCLVLERMAYRRGILAAGHAEMVRLREAREHLEQNARQAWEQALRDGPRARVGEVDEVPAATYTGSGQGGYWIEPYQEGLVRLTFTVQPGDGQETGVKLQVILPAADADRMGDELKASAARVKKDCETRPTSWDRVKKDEPV